MQKCLTCKYWVARTEINAKNPYGECHLNPPTAILMGVNQQGQPITMGVYPSTGPRCECGRGEPGIQLATAMPTKH